MDETITLDDIKKMVEEFVEERDWAQFHTPKNLSSAMTVEAGELLEKFLWVDGQGSYDLFDTKREEIEDELADVLITVICFVNRTDINVAAAVKRKIEKCKAKYPVEKAKGKPLKYTDL